ncbi:hypothetical protein [Maribellus mangrovi]|uniref:hypothetical protein n=1 Tax=Maribellus mangrovi TaxID=3133146 RepID=UPI0030ED749D
MKRLCLLLLGLVFLLPAIAQSEKGYIHLKNGSVIKGKYLYSADGEKLSVESGGSLWIFDAGEVDSITRHRSGKETQLSENETSKLFYRSELGVLAGNSDNSQSAPFSITGSVNYQINAQFSAGLGLGVEFLKESYMPVFANLEYKFRKAPSVPYVFLKAGYQVPLEESNAVYYDVVPLWMSYWPWPDVSGDEPLDVKGGFLINPGVGYQQMFSSNFGMTFAVGYQYHRLNYAGQDDYELDIDYNRVTVKVGIIFK